MKFGIPRFGSCRSDDASYDPYLVRLLGRRIDVLLNGRVLPNVIAYDCRAGWARSTCVRRPKRGCLKPLVRNGTWPKMCRTA
jgi:hypothetical protein